MTRQPRKTTTRPDDVTMFSPSTQRLARLTVAFVIGVIVFGLLVAAAAAIVKTVVAERQSQSHLQSPM